MLPGKANFALQDMFVFPLQSNVDRFVLFNLKFGKVDIICYFTFDHLDHHTVPLWMVTAAIHNFILFHRLKCATSGSSQKTFFSLHQYQCPFPSSTHLCWPDLRFAHLNPFLSSRTASIHRCAGLRSQLLQKKTLQNYKIFPKKLWPTIPCR